MRTLHVLIAAMILAGVANGAEPTGAATQPGAGTGAPAGDLGGEALEYDSQIRPILSQNCFHCHGQDATHRKAKLRLDTQPGQRKEVVVPGKPDESALIKRIFTTDADDLMPPADSHRSLTGAQKQMLRRWIAQGAPFTPHWSYQALVRPVLPSLANAGWVRNPIDAFVLAVLDRQKLAPSAPAGKETLIRRVSLDLTGLPPTEAELDAFLADHSPEAYDKVVDRLLASPHYGERMALPWLDAARYADSNGFQQDGDTCQWVWRDWVVAALNANMPFDRFTIEQLAGDLLPDSTPMQKVATAFNRNHLLNGEGGNLPEEQRYVALFDRVDATSTTWLGLTMACSQCHDHKYDPILQKDYYSLLAAFNQVPETGVAPFGNTSLRIADPALAVFTPGMTARKAELEAEIAAARALAQNGDATAKAAQTKHEQDLDHLMHEELPRVMVMSDAQPRATHILARGNYLSALAEVTCDVPGFLPPLPADAPRNRLGIARWLVSKEQPLTPRVTVNRLWQTLFGIGLVRTSEDFGEQGEEPSNRALLDWLACELRDNGWNIKRMQRLMVTSATYRQSSVVTPALYQRDPLNRLLARAPRFRLSSQLIRDQALAVCGLLDQRIGGKPVYPYQPKDIWDSLAVTTERDFSYPLSQGPDLYRRSIYTFWRRTVAPSNLFDAASRNTCTVRLTATSTPLHALTTLNDPTYVEAARTLAQSVMAAPAPRRLALAFRRTLCRWPDQTEASLLETSLARQQARFRANHAAAEAFLAIGASPRPTGQDPVDLAAYALVCLGILNLDETLTRE